MRLGFYIFIVLMFCQLINTSAQNIDSIVIKSDTVVSKKKIIYLDSATIARNLFIKDSITHIQDSLIWQFIKIPDVNRPNQFINSLLEKYLITDKYLLSNNQPCKTIIFKYGTGENKNSNKIWIIIVVLSLIISFSILKYFYNSEIVLIFTALYHTKTLSKINKERNVFSSWQFLVLYILFCLTLGLYLYLITNKLGNIYNYVGLTLFLSLSGVTLFLLSLKIILLRFLGFVFNITNMVSQYIHILYITLFNTLFVLLPFLLIFALITQRFSLLVIWLSVFVLALIYIIRLIKAAIIVLSKHTFSKTYLFLYVCAFEICPIIILIKALNIS
ncbi:MAG: DUF4271 domain-containing protein [Sphingobacteriales bacterium]|nr:MAG: DUF4271 domain-containing protein [Sphingobacteriales bacterium]